MKTYFISDGARVKIGRSTNPSQRLASLQTAFAAELAMLLALEGDREKELHQRFAAHRLRGEWFTLHDDIKAFIDDPSIPCILPPLIKVERNKLIERKERFNIVSADEMLHRFDAAGGQVHHFVGKRTSYATTIRKGRFRFFYYKKNLFSTDALIDRFNGESYSLKTYEEVNRRLKRRAEVLPPVEPRLEPLDHPCIKRVMLINEYLDLIDAATLDSKDEIHGAINQWCRFIETIATEPSEVERAFNRRYYIQHLAPILDEYAEQASA